MLHQSPVYIFICLYYHDRVVVCVVHMVYSIIHCHNKGTLVEQCNNVEVNAKAGSRI